MLVDAIILTGGRSSRLDFMPKSEFTFDASTLLDRALAAVDRARQIVVVGPEPSTPLPDGVLVAREEPPFSGPAAGVAAGLGVLAPSDAVLVLACDMPHSGLAVSPLLLALESSPDAHGVIAVDGQGRRQPLAAIYRTERLREAVDAHSRAGSLVGLPMFRLLEGMALVDIEVPRGATDDVDSWDDAFRLGIRPPDQIFTEPTFPNPTHL